MKRSLISPASPIALGLITLVLILPMGLAAQQYSSVVVLPVENRTGDRSLDALAETIYVTVLLNLRLLADSSDATTMAGIVSGVIERDTVTNDFIISAEVRDPHSHDVLATPSVRAAGLLAVFSAADQLTDEVLVVMAGRRLSYGGLLLRTENQAVLQFELNGQPIGSGRQLRLGTVAAGEYQLDVHQDRLLGLETVFSATVVVEPERETIVLIPVPLLTTAEERHFNSQDLLVRTAAINGNGAEVLRLIDQQIAELENPLLWDTSPGYTHMHHRYQLWRRHVEASNIQEITPNDTSLQEAIHLAGRFFHIPTVAPIFQRRPTAALVVERYATIPIRSISIDGDLSDWAGILPLVTADSDGYDHQQRQEDLATEIEAVYLAQDESSYSMSFILSDGDITTTTATEPVYQVFVLVNPPTWDQIGMRVKWESENRRWAAAIFRYTQSTQFGQLLAPGTFRISGHTLEARFPRRLLDRELEAGRQYQVVVQTATVNRATREWRTHDQVRTHITF